MNISDVDENLKIETAIKREGLTFFDAKKPPFSIHGAMYENGEWVRLPDSVAREVSEGVHFGSKRMAGGRIRFVTDSPYIVIKTEQAGALGFSHMTSCGQAGFDLYVRYGTEERYVKTFMPPYNISGGFDGVVDFCSIEERIVTLNFPLYFDLKELYIGVKSGSVLKKAPDYTVKTPIVFYGSSITQGGCASRPGNSYQGFLSRKYDADYINLGFSGSARGEDEMAKYIATLRMSAFVYDYDYNAPTAEHLKQTHERFYRIVREAHPDIPILIMSRPAIYLNEDEVTRRDIVYSTYTAARARGEDVYHIFGTELMQLCGNEGTVDGVHPNDLGFFSMAERVCCEFDKFIDKLR